MRIVLGLSVSGLFLLSLFLLLNHSPQLPKNTTIVAVVPQTQTGSMAKIWWLPRHKTKLWKKDSMPKVDLLMIGDSITHRWEKEGNDVWDTYYGHRNALNLGFDGDRTENVVWRLQNGAVDGISPKLVVLMIGTNNAGYRSEHSVYTAAGIRMILDELQLRLPNTNILLLGIFPRGATHNHALRTLNMETNKIIRQLADNKRIHFIDIGSSFLTENGDLRNDLMPDLVHLNSKGYAVWAQAIEAQVVLLMNDESLN